VLAAQSEIEHCRIGLAKDCMGTVEAPQGFIVMFDGWPRFACLRCAEVLRKGRG
jgi:hypothetical protein